jgi:RNA-directed DNA polymerase
VLDVLPKRLAKYGLTLHPEKTRLINFERPDRRTPTSPDRNGDACARPGTFDLLGFTHYWAMSRKGYWVVKQKTAADRFRRTLKRIADWCRQYRHEPVRDQWLALRRKLLGHFGYFGITRNFKALRNLRHWVIAVWRKWLSRRSQRARLSWEEMLRLLARYPLPEAHSLNCRYVANPWTEEPDAVVPHVRIRGSLGGAIFRGDPTVEVPHYLAYFRLAPSGHLAALARLHVCRFA